MDFLRGAAICPEGGKPILALPSSTKKGESKIVPYLKQGVLITQIVHKVALLTQF